MDRSVSGVNIKALTGNTEETSKVCSWLENGVFEALKLKYVIDDRKMTPSCNRSRSLFTREILRRKTQSLLRPTLVHIFSN